MQDTHSAVRARPLLPALRFESDAFHLRESRIMGRQSAGHAFLRALVADAAGERLTGIGPNPASAEIFEASVKAIDPRAQTHWASSHDLGAIALNGGLHLPDPSLGSYARLRQRIGCGAYSITGLTHTISSDGAMGLLADLAIAPVMPWDALICTSDAVKASITTLLETQDDDLRWRLGTQARSPRPELPVIPLGVHCADYADVDGAAASARASLEIGADEIAFLFLGRLSFHAKAHPFPMYEALEAVARESGKKIVLIQCGWFANSSIESAFKDGAQRFAPSIRHIWLDGAQEKARTCAWAASDVFISLSDNIQETFGLTIIEAMAAGKPVIASDWDGYRQTVRHAETGFLIPTFMPQAEVGDAYGLAYASQAINYDIYIGIASQHVSIDLRALRQAVRTLVDNPILRAIMGARGRAVARRDFDWPVIMSSYRTLWAELAERRSAAAAERRSAAAAEPHAMQRRTVAQQINPFRLFATYPSSRLDFRSHVALRSDGPNWREVADHLLFSVSQGRRPGDAVFDAVVAALGAAPAAVGALAAALAITPDAVLCVVSMLAKWGVVELSNSGPLRSGPER